MRRDPLEDGKVVVVHAAHQTRVDAKGQSSCSQDGANRVKVGARLAAQEIHQLGRPFNDRLHRRVLAVQDAQRVGVQAPTRVFVQHGRMGLQVGDQCRPVSLTLVGLTQAVELQKDIALFNQAQFAPQGAQQQDQLGVNIGAHVAQCLDIQLMELPVAPFLRPLMAKHRPHQPDPQGAVVQRVVLVDGAHDAGRGLGSQRQAVTVHAVFERVHLLLDDVRHLSQAAHKQGCGLHDGRAQIAVTITRQQTANDVFKPFPTRGFGRQDVVHALDRAQHGAVGLG